MSDISGRQLSVGETKSCVEVDVLLVDVAQRTSAQQVCSLVVEDTITIVIEGLGSYTLLWTPTACVDEGLAYTRDDGVLGGDDDSELLALVLGFMFSEGLIKSLAEVVSMVVCPDNHDLVEVELEITGDTLPERRNVTITSSCGICGARDIIEKNPLKLQQLEHDIKLDADAIVKGMKSMTVGQKIFQLTGGSHAAAQMNLEGKLLSICEDLGRHNALDKVIGKTILTGQNLGSSCVLLSSRLSLEMVLKSIRAGVQVVAAVGAPTSLAVEIADAFGLTLCSFVRDQRLTVFTHSKRISQSSER